MKKTTKIFAAVLTLAMAMSTAVMPVSAAALQYDFTTTEAGVHGKHATDKIKTITGQYRPHTSGSYEGVSSDSVTYEAQLCFASTSKTVLEVWNSNKQAHSERGVMRFEDGDVYIRAVGDTYGNATAATSATYTTGVWYKIAITKTSTEWQFYIDGRLIGTTADAHLKTGIFTKDYGFDTTSGGTVYVDNMRIYEGVYDPENDVMPVAATGLEFIEKTMTVAEAKTLALATQGNSPAAVHVYKDGVGGTEAADTEMLGKDWYVVITSKSGDLYRADGIYRVSSAIDCTGVAFADNTVTATVINNMSEPLDSMMMVLVEDGGQFVMSSEVKTNIGDNATFTITGVDSLSNAEVFFVRNWADLAPVMDSTFEVE